MTTAFADFFSASAGVPGRANIAVGAEPRGGYVSRVTGDYVGTQRIVGTVAIKGTPNTPAARRVHLHDQVSGRFVAATWSTTQGDYSFERVTPGLYYLVSFDHTGQFNGVIESSVRPV